MIIKRTLVVIGNLAVWIPREEMVGEFHKIEGAAVLTIIAREMLTLLGWLEEMLLIGKLACYKGMDIDQCPKEKLCRLTTIFCTKYLIVSRLTQEFRDEGIGMVGAEVVVAILQWVYLLVMIEILCHQRYFSSLVKA